MQIVDALSNSMEERGVQGEMSKSQVGSFLFLEEAGWQVAMKPACLLGQAGDQWNILEFRQIWIQNA